MDNIRTTIKKYKTSVTVSTLICATISVLIMVLPGNLMTLPLGIVFYIIARSVISDTAIKTYLYPALFKDADPQKFKAMLEKAGGATGHALENITAAYYGGDHQAVINMCTHKLRDPKQQRNKYYYMMYLARAYFELGDTEALQDICQRFENETDADKKGETIRQNYTVMRFYKHYLKGEHQACKEIYDKAAAKDFGDNVTTEVQVKFTYAVACYNVGEIQKAKEIFNYILVKAPKLHFSKLSEEYIEAINDATEYMPKRRHIEPDDSFSLPSQGKRARIITTLLYSLLFLSLIVIVIFTIADINMSFKLF